jgi:hypothetical protein
VQHIKGKLHGIANHLFASLLERLVSNVPRCLINIRPEGGLPLAVPSCNGKIDTIGAACLLVMRISSLAAAENCSARRSRAVFGFGRGQPIEAA